MSSHVHNCTAHNCPSYIGAVCARSTAVKHLCICAALVRHLCRAFVQEAIQWTTAH